MSASLKQFGHYLSDARHSTGRTQQQVVRDLAKMGHKVSQGLIAQYETGKVADPDPKILLWLATLYQKDYTEMVFELAQNKYAPLEGDQDLSDARWALFKRALKRFPITGEVASTDLEVEQLRAKAEMVKNDVMLSPSDIHLWSRHVPSLEYCYVMSTDRLDDSKEAIAAIAFNIAERNTVYRYGVAQRFIDTGRLDHIKHELNDRVGEGLVQTNFHPIPIAPTLFRTDFLIANPHRRDEMVGFQYFGAKTKYMIQMHQHELETVVDNFHTRYREQIGTTIWPRQPVLSTKSELSAT